MCIITISKGNNKTGSRQNSIKTEVVFVWPFENRLKDQDGVERYRRWLKRWLLDGRKDPVLDKLPRLKIVC